MASDRDHAWLLFTWNCTPDQVAEHLGVDLATAQRWYDRWLDRVVGEHYEHPLAYRIAAAGVPRQRPAASGRSRRTNGDELGSITPTHRVRHPVPAPVQPAPPAETCGTYNGWMRHVRRHEPACQACLDARSEYRRRLNLVARRAADERRVTV